MPVGLNEMGAKKVLKPPFFNSARTASRSLRPARSTACCRITPTAAPDACVKSGSVPYFALNNSTNRAVEPNTSSLV